MHWYHLIHSSDILLFASELMLVRVIVGLCLECIWIRSLLMLIARLRSRVTGVVASAAATGARRCAHAVGLLLSVISSLRSIAALPVVVQIGRVFETAANNHSQSLEITLAARSTLLASRERGE